MLKAHIQDSGVSRDVWAERFGIGRSYLSLLESGQKTPSLPLAVRIERETGGAVPATSWIPEAPENGAEAAA
jgi:transcriptional regulator with XRE-family HTH domain